MGISRKRGEKGFPGRKNSVYKTGLSGKCIWRKEGKKGIMRFEKDRTQDRGPLSQALRTMTRRLNFMGKEMGKCFKQASDMIRLVFRMIS